MGASLGVFFPSSPSRLSCLLAQRGGCNRWRDVKVYTSTCQAPRCCERPTAPAPPVPVLVLHDAGAGQVAELRRDGLPGHENTAKRRQVRPRLPFRSGQQQPRRIRGTEFNSGTLVRKPYIQRGQFLDQKNLGSRSFLGGQSHVCSCPAILCPPPKKNPRASPYKVCRKPSCELFLSIRISHKLFFSLGTYTS